jgi:hypothetical protein
MKKLFLILILLISFLSAEVFDYMDGTYLINKPESYFGGVDRDEMTLKQMYVQRTFSNAGGVVYINQAFPSFLTSSNYTVTSGYKFIPLFMRITKFSILAVDDPTFIRIETINRSTVTNTNVIGEMLIPTGANTYDFNYPFTASDPSSTSTTSKEVVISAYHATNADISLAIMLYGIEIEN